MEVVNDFYFCGSLVRLSLCRHSRAQTCAGLPFSWWDCLKNVSIFAQPFLSNTRSAQYRAEMHKLVHFRHQLTWIVDPDPKP